MALETGTYISDLNSSNSSSLLMVSPRLMTTYVYLRVRCRLLSPVSLVQSLVLTLS